MESVKDELSMLGSSPLFRKVGGETVHIDSIGKYVDLLIKWNEKMNLTGIFDRQQVVNTLVLESLFGLEFIPQCGNLLDIGSGAGIPGIIIKIFRPELRIYLVESREKKAVFLQEVIRSLSLRKISVLNCSFEIVYKPGNLSSSSLDVVTLRAVRLNNRILSGVDKLLMPGGKFLLYSYLTDEDEESLDSHNFKLLREVSHLGRSKPVLYAYMHIARNR